MLVNLAVNARDAMGGGRLTLTTADVELDERCVRAAGVAPGRTCCCGWVDVASEPGRGAVFSVYLPAVEPVEHASAA